MAAPVTAFLEDRIIARGDRAAVTRALKQRWPTDQGQLRVFDDATGRPVDLDFWDAAQGHRKTKPVIPAKAGIQTDIGTDRPAHDRPLDPRLREEDEGQEGSAENPPRNGEGDRSPPANGGGVPAPTSPGTRGRPKLGVVAREVTLLPRHWDWLAGQPGGASAALRRLVEAARKQPPSPAQARDAVYRFLTEMAGDRPGYEEALRALYRVEETRFLALIADWPEDVRDYAERLLAGFTAP